MSEKAEVGAARGFLAFLVGVAVALLFWSSLVYGSELDLQDARFACSSREDIVSAIEEPEEIVDHDVGCSVLSQKMLDRATFFKNHGPIAGMLYLEPKEGQDPNLPPEKIKYKDPVEIVVYEYCVDQRTVYSTNLVINDGLVDKLRIEGMFPFKIGIPIGLKYELCGDDPRGIMIAHKTSTTQQVAGDLDQGGVTVVYKTPMTQIATITE